MSRKTTGASTDSTPTSAIAGFSPFYIGPNEGAGALNEAMKALGKAEEALDKLTDKLLSNSYDQEPGSPEFFAAEALLLAHAQVTATANLVATIQSATRPPAKSKKSVSSR